MYKISKSVFLYVLTASLLFISCKSLKPPKTVPAPLNYTDNDIVKIEIDRINKFLETEPVRALWRACLLGNEEIVEKCRKAVELRLEVSLEEREYLDTRKYYKSLMSAFPGWKHEKYSLQQIEEKRYEADLLAEGILKERIYKLGIAFSGKDVYVKQAAARA